MDINTLLYIFFIVLGSFATAAPLCSKTMDIASSGPPNSGILTIISASVIKELQLAYFLENLEASFFNTSLINITKWGINEYNNNTIEIVTKIAAVSVLLP
jgi:hypothetical protein